MADQDETRFRVSEAGRVLVEYDQRSRTDLRLFMEESHWPRFAPYFKAVADHLNADLSHEERRLKGVVHALLGHPRDGRDGVRFGSRDRSVEWRLATLLGLVEGERGQLQSARPAGRPPGSAAKTYPFEQLESVGDCFLVSGELTHSDHCGLSGVCKRRGLEARRVFKTHRVSGGVLVVLVEGEGLSAQRKVEL